MTLTVHPDPQEPAGGFAFLEVPEGSLRGDTAPVAVFDAYGQRWLAASEESGARIGIGDPHWQQDRHTFGPYKVYRHQGADWVRIGPEIVNKIEEYAPLKITVGADEYDVTWPDDVPPRAGAAVLGGLRPVARPAPEENTANLVGQVSASPPVPEPEPVPAPAPEPEGLTDETVIVPRREEEEPRRFGILPLLMLLLLLVAGASAAAWWYWPRDPGTEEQAEEPAPEPESFGSDETCTPQVLRAAGPGFAAVGAAIRACGASVTPDDALAIIEDFAGREDGDALMLFGTLYDGENLDDGIENRIGLSFSADDARAAEYYARAVTAGAAGAQDRLTATCARLAEASSTLAKGAYDDFCG